MGALKFAQLERCVKLESRIESGVGGRGHWGLLTTHHSPCTFLPCPVTQKNMHGSRKLVVEYWWCGEEIARKPISRKGLGDLSAAQVAISSVLEWTRVVRGWRPSVGERAGSETRAQPAYGRK